MEKIRRALGRSAESPAPPTPPAIPDAITRLVPANADLAKVFAANAKEQKMSLTQSDESNVAASLVEFVRQNPIKRVALSSSDLLSRLRIRAALQAAGIETKTWEEISLDELYDFDCAVTDVQCAVAENATLVIRPSAKHGRGLSLVPMFHIAVVERSQIIPDLVDLFAQMNTPADRSNMILITGPSKTADIEMNVVTGVHGPNVVKVFAGVIECGHRGVRIATGKKSKIFSALATRQRGFDQNSAQHARSG